VASDGQSSLLAIVFLVVALVAAFLGLGGVATEFAQILFWVAIILVPLSFDGGMVRA
jgi:uncharacterized membrane protein YtjA (UPF0391 family)